MKSILLTCLVAATTVTHASATPKANPQSLLDLDLALAAQEQQQQQQLQQRPTLLDLVLAAAEQEAAVQQQQQAQPTLLDLVLAAAEAQQEQAAAPVQPQTADNLDIAEARRVLLGGGIIGGGQRRIIGGGRRLPSWGLRPGVVINRRIPIRRSLPRVG